MIKKKRDHNSIARRNVGLAGVLGALSMIVGCPPQGTTDPDGDSAFVWSAAFDAASAGALSSVWGSSPSDVFIVGGKPQQGEVYHYDGLTWRVMDVPAVPLLVWVYGFGPDDVFAVGEGGGALHYDGQSWTTLESGTTENLWGVWGAARDDLWVVGGSVGEGQPVILHYDGAAFTAYPPPANDRGATALFKVWGIGSKIFAVGEDGLIVQYMAADDAWVQVPAGEDADDDFVSLWGTSENNIVAVGGRSSARVSRYDGTQWTTKLFAETPGLNGVTTVSASEAIVAGANGFVGRFSIPSGTLTAEASNINECLHAAWSNGIGTVYAVGGRFSTPYAGAVLLRRLGAPGAATDPPPPPIRSCSTSSDCPDGQECEGGTCVSNVECVQDTDCAVGEICTSGGTCLPVVECFNDADCASGESCRNGECQTFGTLTCTGEVECTFLEECRQGSCTPVEGRDIDYWARTGSTQGPVETGDELTVFRGSQGGVHTFVDVFTAGFDTDLRAFLTVRITRNDTGAIVTDRRLDPTLRELSPGVGQARGLFVLLDFARPGQLINVPATVELTLEDQLDPSQSANLSVEVVLNEVEE